MSWLVRSGSVAVIGGLPGLVWRIIVDRANKKRAIESMAPCAGAAAAAP